MIEKILGVIGTILYPLFSIIFTLIDGIQGIFGAFAGIDNVKVGSTKITAGNTGDIKDTGIVYYLFQSDIVKNMLMSVAILGLFLLVIFTVIAFIKNVYASKQKSWKDIIGAALIGLMNFVFVPAVSLLGVWLGNILLNAVNGATSATGATSMAGNLFVASAYNANKVRIFVEDGEKGLGWDINDSTTYGDVGDGSAYWTECQQYYTNLSALNTSSKYIELDETKAKNDPAYLANKIDEYHSLSGSYRGTYGIKAFYKLSSINYLVLAAGGCFMIYVLAAISFGMVKRLFMLLVLFIISPAMCALYPIDDGNAVKKWKDEFVKNVLSAFGAVAGMNIFFAILPPITNIKISDAGAAGKVLDALGLTSVLLTIAGLFVVKDVISFISGAIGAGNAYADGSSLMKSTTGAIKNARNKRKNLTKKTGEFVKKGAGVFGTAKGASDAGGNFFESLMSQAGNATLRNTIGFTKKDITDEFKKSSKDSFDYQTAESKRKEENAEYKSSGAKAQVDALISGAGGAPIDPEKAAPIINALPKHAQQKALRDLAVYNNKHGKLGTTADSLKEDIGKVQEQESARAGAYGAAESYGAVQTLMGTLDRSFYDPATHSLRTTTKVDPATLARLETRAKRVSATVADINAYNNAVAQNETIEKYKEITREAKSSASQLAQSILALAENYKGQVKQDIITIANKLRQDVNGAGNLNDVESAVASARTAISGIAGKGTEINNILNTGSR